MPQDADGRELAPGVGVLVEMGGPGKLHPGRVTTVGDECSCFTTDGGTYRVPNDSIRVVENITEYLADDVRL